MRHPVSHYDLTTFYILRQKFVKFFVGFLENLRLWKIHSEINWPLEKSWSLLRSFNLAHSTGLALLVRFSISQLLWADRDFWSKLNFDPIHGGFGVGKSKVPQVLGASKCLKLDSKQCKGPFKYYVIMFLTFLGPLTDLFDDLQYCKSSKIAIFWPHPPTSLMM